MIDRHPTHVQFVCNALEGQPLQMSKTKNLARWSRTFDYHNIPGDANEKYLAKGGSGNEYFPFLLDYKNQAFYFFNSNPLFLPLSFDSEFKKTVVPYLDLEKVSLKKDPFKDADF